jgi:hypothetical protein
MSKNKVEKLDREIDSLELKIEKEIERISKDKKSHNKISNELIRLMKESLKLRIASK